MKARFPASVALFAASVLCAGYWNPRVAGAANSYAAFEGEKTTWHDDFDRYDYLMDEASFAITPLSGQHQRSFRWAIRRKGSGGVLW